MNKKSRMIIDEMLKSGLITKEEDLTAGDETNFFFDFLLKNYGYMLNHDPEVVMSDEYLSKGNMIHKIIMRFGKYFLANPQIIEDREKLLEGDEETFSDDLSRPFKKVDLSDDEPVVFVSNHKFKDDLLATILAAEKRTFLLLGSLPRVYNTFDGILSYKNGVVIINRKVKESRKSAVAKCKRVLESGNSLLVCPEGVWDKSPNRMLLDFYGGFYDIAQKEDGTFYKVVPVIHYISNTYTPGKDNPIHTIVDDPIDFTGMTKEEAIEYLRTRMGSWYFKMIEKYGKSTRKEMLAGYASATEAWEDELRKRVATAGNYDLEIELTADKRRKDEPLDVWGPIAELPITKENAYEVVRAKQLVKELKRNDFQHRF